MTTTLTQLWVSLGFLLFLTLLLISSPSPFCVIVKNCYVLCSWWWEKKKYINKNRMIEKEKLRNERDVVLQYRPWWEGLPVKSRQPAISNQIDVDIWWLSLSSRAFNGRAVPLTVCLEGVPHFFHISFSLLKNWTNNKGQIDFSPFQHEELSLALYLSPNF